MNNIRVFLGLIFFFCFHNVAVAQNNSEAFFALDTVISSAGYQGQNNPTGIGPNSYIGFAVYVKNVDSLRGFSIECTWDGSKAEYRTTSSGTDVQENTMVFNGSTVTFASETNVLGGNLLTAGEINQTGKYSRDFVRQGSSINTGNYGLLHMCVFKTGASFTAQDILNINVHIKITNDSGILRDLGSRVFSVNQTVYPINVLSPNGGEHWQGNTRKVITWQTVSVNSVNIEYSADNGSSWATIGSHVDASKGYYPWSVPNNNASKCLVRITDSNNSSVFDKSNGTFSIISTPSGSFTPSALTLSSPETIHYAFDHTQLSIPVTVSGTPALVTLCVFTKDKASEIISTRNGFLGWHYVNKIDTCVYVAAPVMMSEGNNTITWDGRDNDGKICASGDYTYYLWGYDAVNARVAAINITAGNSNAVNIRPFYDTQILEKDENGIPLANPVFAGKYYKWKIGNDPVDAQLLETMTVYSESGWVQKQRYVIQPDDWNYVFFPMHNPDWNTGGIWKYRWVPNGEAVVEKDWGDGGVVLWDQTQNRQMNAVTDGIFLYVTANPYQENYFHDELWIVDIDSGMLMELFDITEFWASIEDYDRGGQMHGGPGTMSIRNNLLFLGCHCSCLKQVIDPMRGLDDFNDLVVYVNGNGDYILDHNFAPDATMPWVCNDYNVGPYTYTFVSDANYFALSPSFDLGAVSFGLLAPDGTGMGYYAFAGETAAYKYGIDICDNGSAFDGIYSTVAKTTSDGTLKTEDGTWYSGWDSIKGTITSSVVTSAEVPSSDEEISAYFGESSFAASSRITIPVYIDMSKSSYSLGEYSVSVLWSTSRLRYVSTSGGATSGWSNPLVNDSGTGQGELKCSGIYAQGSSGNVNVFNIVFDVIGSAGSGGTLDLKLISLSAAKSYDNLLSITTIGEYTYTIAGAAEEGIWGDVNGNETVNSADGLIIASYGINIPAGSFESGVLKCGDVNADGKKDLADGLICARYGIQPDYSGLPARIGRRLGTVAKMVPEQARVLHERAIPTIEAHVSETNDIIIDSSVSTAGRRTLIGAASVILRWDPNVFRYNGIDENSTGSIIINDSLTGEGELRIARIRVNGETAFGFPGVRLQSLHENHAGSVSLEVLDAVDAEMFAYLETDHRRVYPDDGLTGMSPVSFKLRQNVPNPFNPVTSISYTVSAPAHVVLTLYNVYGQKVRILADRYESSGTHEVIWDGTDDDGRIVSSGVYIYQLVTSGWSDRKQMLLLR